MHPELDFRPVQIMTVHVTYNSGGLKKNQLYKNIWKSYVDADVASSQLSWKEVLMYSHFELRMVHH